MPEPDGFSPQLVMVRAGLGDLPRVELPAGHWLATFRPGWATAWEEIINESFGKPAGHCNFEHLMRADPAFRPGRIFFVLCGEEPVATASAWRHPAKMADAGAVHYVGARIAHQGKRLGYWVSLAALHRIKQEGLDRAWLLTDDYRVPAIKTYLRLGFGPLLAHENQRRRWAEIFEVLGRPELRERFRSALEGPVWEPTRHPVDDFDYGQRVTFRSRWLPERRSGRIEKAEMDAFADESLYCGAALGTAGAAPCEVPAGGEAPFELWFRAGSAGLPAGTEVLFWTPGQSPLGTRPQTKDAAQPGFVELVAPEGVEAMDGPGFRTTRELGKEAEVRLRIGHTAGFKWTPLAGRKEFKVVIDMGSGEPLMRLPEPVVIRVLPGEVDHLDVFVPGTARAGAGVRATVTSRDAFDNRVPVDGAVDLRCGRDAVSAHLHEGLGGVTLPGVGGGPLVVETSDGRARSNPCLPCDGPQLYFGDLHAHDLNSQAEGYTADVYRWAVEDKRLDFLAVPVQVHSYLDNDKWLAAKLLNETYLDEGRFVTLLSFEWQHSHYGDKVVHYLGGDAPYLPIDDARYATPMGLYEAVRGADALVVSHHPGYALDLHVPGTDWAAMETDVDRLVELWSMHGSSEGHDAGDRPLVGARREEGVLAGLRKGLRFGFTAGSDTHSGRPGGSAKEPRPYWGGLCAVWADELTRRGLFEALRARRTYALTGARIALRFTVNGAAMGSEVSMSAERRLAAEVHGTCAIAKVELMRDGEVLHQERPGADACVVEFEDRSEAPSFYHCRVTQADGHLAVCSPVWVG